MDKQQQSRIVLHGQTAVVTGASSGIGADIARELGSAGANVVVNYAHNQEGAKAVVQEIQERGGRAFASKADVSRENDVQEPVSCGH